MYNLCQSFSRTLTQFPLPLMVILIYLQVIPFSTTMQSLFPHRFLSHESFKIIKLKLRGTNLATLKVW